MNEKKNCSQINCEQFKGLTVMKVIKAQVLAPMEKTAGKKLIDVYYDLYGNELFRVDPEN